VARHDQADMVRTLQAAVAMYRKLRNGTPGDLVRRSEAEAAAERFLDALS
jgi:hypothetical protein